ncbi:MAG TPA: RNA polymerase subunit sigma-70 [Streptosporangiaceae bacterium]|nr:RNA polymerase subunit sigma-70 [Streptosporangiaceae bacterium]
MAAELVERAQSGDGEAFRELTDPYRRELQVHCYRFLGSLQDAEDALQDILLAAWRGLGRFEGRSSVRTWLYQIATHRCLNMLRSARRQPAEWSLPGVEPPEPSGFGEVTWLEPYPDALLEGVAQASGPEARYEASETISLAFVTALQLLPPRQRAVLILRDVLGFSAAETAGMVSATIDSVNSALKRARAAAEDRAGSAQRREPPPPAHSPAEQALAARLTTAYQAGDVGQLVALLTDDVRVSMPPVPLEYHGLDSAARFHAAVVFRHGRTYDLIPTRANGQLAFAAYVRDPAGGVRHAMGLLVMSVSGEHVTEITRFDNTVLASFGLPRSLPGSDPP